MSAITRFDERVGKNVPIMWNMITCGRPSIEFANLHDVKYYLTDVGEIYGKNPGQEPAKISGGTVASFEEAMIELNSHLAGMKPVGKRVISLGDYKRAREESPVGK